MNKEEIIARPYEEYYEMIKDMDLWLSNYAHLTKNVIPDSDMNIPGTGAAGGLGFAFLSYMNATLESGIDLVIKHGKAHGLVGETGAGKSIIIDSINALCGGRTSRELIRTGESVATVSAYFEDLSPEALAKASELRVTPSPTPPKSRISTSRAGICGRLTCSISKGRSS